MTYDARNRAPASEGDVLGFISLGCNVSCGPTDPTDKRPGFTIGKRRAQKEGLMAILEMTR